MRLIRIVVMITILGILTHQAYGQSDSSPTAFKQLLLQSLEADEFQKANPFQPLVNETPIQEILAQGVLGFERKIYRSPQFIWGSGYDIVKYRIRQSDETYSYIFAYKKKTDAGQVTIQGTDFRPTFIMFLKSISQEKVEISLYRDNLLDHKAVMELQSAMAEISELLQSSTPLLASR